MARIFFDLVVDSTPYDLDRELIEWVLAGAGYPAALPGLRGPARTFSGASGYAAKDESDVHMGLRAVTIRTLLRPDFDALAGLTATIAARGSNGATAGEYWAWDVRLAVNGGASQATVTLAWQDETGAVVAHALGTFDRPPAGAWTHLSVTRETVGDEHLLRLSVNGVPFGEVTATDQVPATPGEAVTLGCRANQSVGSGFDQFFEGDLELVEVLDQAVSELQEQHAAHAILRQPDEALAVVQGYWFDTDVVEIRNGSNYERYRLRPLAAMQSEVDMAVLRRQEAGLPNTAYAERLEEWEAALGLVGSDRLSLAERRARAAAALALVEGIGFDFLSAYAYSLVDGVVPQETGLLEQYEELAGVQFQYLWVGQDTDLVAGASLTASGGALDGQAPMRETLYLGRDVFRFAGAADEVFAASASVAEIEDANDVLLMVGFYVAQWPAATSVVCGKQDLTAPLPRVGYQLFLLSTGEARFDLSDDLGGVVQLTLSKIVAGWNVITIKSNRIANVITADDGFQQVTTSSAGLSYENVEVFRLGDARIARPEPSFPGDVRFFGVAHGTQVRDADQRALTRRMRAAMGAVYEQQNDITVDFRKRYGWRVYGNLGYSFNGTRVTLGIANTAVTSKYTIPPPTSNSEGAGFQEIAVGDTDWRVLLDMAPDPANPATTSRWAGFVMRANTDVQWISIRADDRLYALRSLGGAVATSEDLGALPASASKRWELAISYVAATGKTRVRSRAIENTGDVTAWNEHLTNNLPIAAPNWIGLGAQANLTGNQAQAFIYSMRIALCSTPAKRWYLLAGVPKIRSIVDDLLRRKNRATAFVGYSRDDHAIADSSNTFAGSTPTPGI